MSSDVGLPMWGEDDDDIVFDVFQFAREAFVAPTQGLPAAFGICLILLRIVGVDEVRRVWCEATCDDFSLCHC